MAEESNVLFIMCDQLRWDHLSCYGHPYLRTPNLDALARRGVRFTNAFVNSGVCGPSRMSFYTGRYPSSHGATWNRVPLPIGECTLGEYLQETGRGLSLAGKTHILPDVEGLRRAGLAAEGAFGRGHFREVDRYDGHHPPGAESGYADYLRAQGYRGDDPWSRHVISARTADGRLASGWNMRNAGLPALVDAADSETAYMTQQAKAFMVERGDRPWCLHLSYVKPHWPYMAPSPYHRLYSPDQCLPAVRSEREKHNAHPILQAYWNHEESRSFQVDECITTVRPTYQGLVRQLDDELGRLFEFMDARGLLDRTLIVFTSDHGDFLGDHWLGEKELFYDTVQKVPLIIVDPSATADKARGTTCGQFVESVDIVPTVLDFLDIALPTHRLEGHSLLGHCRGSVDSLRDFTVSELDFSFRQARLDLGLAPDQCYGWSIRTSQWRYVYWLAAPEQLYDLAADPDQMADLGQDTATLRVREEMRQSLLKWFAKLKRRATVSHEQVTARTNTHKQTGVFFGQW